MAQRDTIPFEQERIIRAFLRGADDSGLQLPRSIVGQLIGMLGYQSAPNGALIWNNIEIKYPLGVDHSNRWTDTYESDWQERCDDRAEEIRKELEAERALAEAEEAALRVDYPIDTSPSESPEGN
jgi:hypothetical protein